MTIFCIGSATLDLVFSSTDTKDVRPDGKILVDDFEMRPGGASYLAAGSIVEAGGTASVIARTGKDRSAKILKDLLKDAEIDNSGIIEIDGHRTTTASIHQNGKDRSIVVKADLDLPPALEQANQIDLSKMTAVAATQRWPEFAEVALKKAKENNLPGILNIEISREKSTKSFMENASHLVFSKEGLTHWTGQEELSKALKVIDKEFPNHNIVITLAEKGVLFREPNGEYLNLPKIKSDKALDSLGAGDVFQGIMTLCLSRKKSLEQSILYAAVGVSLKVEKIGIYKASPTMEDIEKNIPLRRRNLIKLNDLIKTGAKESKINQKEVDSR